MERFANIIATGSYLPEKVLTNKDITGSNYGPLKARCEEEARKAFPDASIVVRPGLIVGPGDYSVDEKARQVFLSDQGHEKVEQMLADAGLLAEGESLYDPSNIMLMHHVMAALRAHALFQRNGDYIVRDGEVVLIDEFTGRMMPGRRWGDGLHQAVEAKERVKIQSENQTLATITLQNYFRMYDKLAGMTGTAETEAEEFNKIYGLDCAVVPTNRPMIRADHADVVYKTEKEKFRAVIEEIVHQNERGMPVLVESGRMP